MEHLQDQINFLLIDANNLVYSSYYATSKLTEKKISAFFILLRVFISLLKRKKYQSIFFVFDGGGKNFRKVISSDYKSHRKPPEKEFIEEIEQIIILLEKSGFCCLKMVNHEADDLIASLVEKFRKKNSNFVFDIFSRDKDLMQLLDEKVNVVKYKDRKMIFYSLIDFKREYKFEPRYYADYLSLVGDKADNISGIRGIGPVTAAFLIKEYSNLENLFANLEKTKKEIYQLLFEKKNLAFESRILTTVDKNIEIDLEKLKNYKFSWEEWKNNNFLINYCQENGFHSIIKSLEN